MNMQLKFEGIKKKHDELFSEILKLGPYQAASVDEKMRAPLREKADNLIGIIEEYSKNVTLGVEYTWLDDVAAKWNVLYSSVFNRPKTIRIAKPLRDLRPPLLPGRALSEPEIKGWVSVVATIRGHARRRLSGRPSSPIEMDEDWRFAEAVVVSEILDGRINFARRISSESYPRLEKQWIKYIKCFWAYLEWENRDWEDNCLLEKEDYFTACERLRGLLVNPGMKALPDEFGDVRSYLIQNYITAKGKLDRDRATVKELINRKANRIHGTTGETDDIKNWLHAEKYAKMFYENICPAVLETNQNYKRECTLRVLKAFQFSKAPENGYRVVNCFEVALAIYFLDAKVIQTLWNESEEHTQPPSHVRSSVILKGDVSDFEVPVQLHKRLYFDKEKRQLIFWGVMTEELRDALCASVSNELLCEAIKDLFMQSRLIHRETTL